MGAALAKTAWVGQPAYREFLETNWKYKMDGMNEDDAAKRAIYNGPDDAAPIKKRLKATLRRARRKVVKGPQKKRDTKR